MVLDHWSNDAMVSMDRRGLVHIPGTDTLHAYHPKLDKTVDFLYILRFSAASISFSQSSVEQDPLEQTAYLFPFLDFFKSVGQCGTK